MSLPVKPRRSPRLNGYNYGQNGPYFVTICSQDRIALFGEVVDGEMAANPAGLMIEQWWLRIPEKFPNCEVDSFSVMPNHLHGIIVIVTASNDITLSSIMQWFKTMTTNAYIRGVKEQLWEAFPGKLWQRSYYDHIIRNEASLDNIRLYIDHNPARWNDDENNPSRHTL